LLLLHFSDKSNTTEPYPQWVKLSFQEKH
jgi:hypothetical protein